jgi:acyl-coenzyme A thioesterase PaaI-like protein
MAFCEAEIRSAQNELIARASGTFSYKLQEAT